MKTYYVGQTPYGIYILRPNTRKNGKKYACLGEFKTLREAEQYRNEHIQSLTLQIAEAEPYAEGIPIKKRVSNKDPKRKSKKKSKKAKTKKQDKPSIPVPMRITKNTYRDNNGIIHRQVSIYYSDKPTRGSVGWKDGVEFWVYCKTD